MANQKTNISKTQALSLAKQQHITVVGEFFSKEPIHTALLQGLISKRGEGKELRLLTHLLKKPTPVSSDDLDNLFGWPKSTASYTAKQLNTYLKEFSSSIEPLKVKRKRICIPRQEGGLSVGYHFACLNAKTKEYLDAVATKRLFENLWEDFIRNELCKKLKQESKDELSKKLQGRDDYQILDMEIGVVSQKTKNVINKSMDFTESKTYEHNRKWEVFNIDSLINSSDISSYIISVDAGGGKTTFLRHLQLEILLKSELIPVFLDASKIEEWRLENRHQFAEKLAIYFDLNICKNRVIDFLLRALEEEIILLVDGLDQIKVGGSGYECLVNHVLDLMGKNVIIASRPSAVVNQEDEKQFTFLRLKPFDTKAQVGYFGGNLERAKQLSRNTPFLIAIPMLAHMVRMLIETRQDSKINNRTELYRRFIDYILMEYKHGKAKLVPGLRTQIRMSLEKIAYEALVEKEPYIQRIPLNFCYDKGLLPVNSIGGSDELLTKSGLASLIVEWSGLGIKDFLFFTHQSYQDYLAAKYIARDDGKIQQVISEKWNPKWKEVIKFLAGIRGQSLIERIFNNKDNVLYSHLFLSAELVPEVGKIDENLKKLLIESLENLSTCFPLYGDTILYLGYIDINRVANKLEDSMQCIREAAVNSIRNSRGCLDKKVVNKLIDVLSEHDLSLPHVAAKTLSTFQDQLKQEDINKIYQNIIEDKGYLSKFCSIAVLAQMPERLGEPILNEIIKNVFSENPSNSNAAINALGKIQHVIGLDAIDIIIDKLKDNNPRFRTSAVVAVAELIERFGPKKVIALLGTMLDNENIPVQKKTVFVLNRLRGHIQDEKLLNRINDLYSKYHPVVEKSASQTIKIHEHSEKVLLDLASSLLGDNNIPSGSPLEYILENKKHLDDKIALKLFQQLSHFPDWTQDELVSTLAKLEDVVSNDLVLKIIKEYKSRVLDLKEITFDMFKENLYCDGIYKVLKHYYAVGRLQFLKDIKNER